MYYVSKKLEVSGSHCLKLDYDSPCKHLHGHNWNITVYCKSATLDRNGMIIDFKVIKEIIKGAMDHVNLNDVFSFNPTAENIAKWIVDNVPYCYKAEVEECAGSVATYEI